MATSFGNGSGGSVSSAVRASTGTSAASVKNGSLGGLVYQSERSKQNAALRSSGEISGMTNLFDQIRRQADANSARSEAMADKQNAWQQRQNQIAMEFNASEAAKNRDWQEMMSNTAHQREIKDLQVAGLNPVLSAMGGNGASVTSGATASGVTSAGAKGEVDTSTNQALVSLLGTMISAQASMENQRMSALSNQMIAEKTNAVNELIARIHGDYSLAAGKQSGEYQMAFGKQQGEYGLRSTELAGKYGLSQSQVNAAASMYGANMNYRTQTELQAAQAAQQVLMAQNYPTNYVQAAAAGVGGLQNAVKDPVGTLVNAVSGINGFGAASSSGKKVAAALKKRISNRRK